MTNPRFCAVSMQRSSYITIIFCYVLLSSCFSSRTPSSLVITFNMGTQAAMPAESPQRASSASPSRKTVIKPFGPSASSGGSWPAVIFSYSLWSIYVLAIWYVIHVSGLRSFESLSNGKPLLMPAWIASPTDARDIPNSPDSFSAMDVPVVCNASSPHNATFDTPAFPIDLSGDGDTGICACMPPTASSHGPRLPLSSPYRYSRLHIRSDPAVNLTFSPESPAPRIPLPPPWNFYAYRRGLAKRPRFRQAMKDRTWGGYMPIMKGYWFFIGIVNGNPDLDERLYGVRVTEPTDAERVDAARCEVAAHRREMRLRRELYAMKEAFVRAERAHAQRERRAMQAKREVVSQKYVQAVWMAYLATPTKDVSRLLQLPTNAG